MHQAVGAIFPAAVLLVLCDDETVFHRAYGYLDPETRRRPTRTDSLFDLASLTKLFTATAFMRLADTGAVTPETPVAAVLPEFGGVHPIVPSMDPLSGEMIPPEPQWADATVDADRITFWHLLTHTSGLAAWRPLYRIGETQAPIPFPWQVTPATRGRRVAAICDGRSFAYPTGERLVYSDLGLILLGEAVARLAGEPLNGAIRRLVLEPLGLARAGFNPFSHGAPADEIAPTEICSWRGRRCLGEVHDENAAGLGGVAGHAGLFATAAEVATLGRLYLNGGTIGGRRILSSETVAEMTREQVRKNGLARGLGWQRKSADGGPVCPACSADSYGHTGFTGTSLWVDPARRLVVALLTNRVYGGRDPAGIAGFRPALHEAIVDASR
jgi:CubicO group peptidase (beta-lactamase class C family)